MNKAWLVSLLIASVALAGCADNSTDGASMDKAPALATEDSDVEGILESAPGEVVEGNAGSIGLSVDPGELTGFAPMNVSMVIDATALDAQGAETIVDSLIWSVTTESGDTLGTGSSLPATVTATFLDEGTYILTVSVETSDFGSAQADYTFTVLPPLNATVSFDSAPITRGKSLAIHGNATGGFSENGFTCYWVPDSTTRIGNVSACDTTARGFAPNGTAMLYVNDTINNASSVLTFATVLEEFVTDPSGDTALLGAVPTVMPEADVTKISGAVRKDGGVDFYIEVESQTGAAATGTLGMTYKLVWSSALDGAAVYSGLAISSSGEITCPYGDLRGTGWSTAGTDGSCSLVEGSPGIIQVGVPAGLLRSEGGSPFDQTMSGVYARVEASYVVFVPDVDTTDPTDFVIE